MDVDTLEGVVADLEKDVNRLTNKRTFNLDLFTYHIYERKYIIAAIAVFIIAIFAIIYYKRQKAKRERYGSGRKWKGSRYPRRKRLNNRYTF